MPEMHLQNSEKVQSRKKRRKNVGSRIFARGEDSRALRLASELADLRAANADYILCRVRHRIGRIGLLPLPTQKPPDWVAVVLAGVAGFGPTNEGVKVPCLTAWLYPYKILLDYSTIKKPRCQ